MAVISSSVVGLIELYKSQDANGQIIPVIEILSEINPILDDAMAVECNQGTTHKHAIRTGLPTVTWGKLYKGTPQSKGRRAQVEDTTGFVEGLSTVDKRLLKLSGNEGAVRLAEGKSYLESMSQEVATKIFYGNSASDPDEFMGFAPRYNSLSATNGNNIIDGGGTGNDNTSVWFITWGDMQSQLLYPKGTQAGVQREDKGEQKVYDDDNNPYWAMEELFTWNIGLAVKDWRYNVRIANIDVSEMLAGNVELYGLFRKAFYKMYGRRISGGKSCIYLNSDVLEQLDAQATPTGAANNSVRLTPMNIEGKEVLTYRGMPLRETDALLNTEARVV